MVARSNTTGGTTEVWQAHALAPLTNVKVTAELRQSYDATITVATFEGTTGQISAAGVGAGTSGAAAAKVIPTECNSLVWAVGHDWSKAELPAPGTSQDLRHTFLDERTNDSYWIQDAATPTISGQPVVVTDTGLARKDRWTMVAIEIAGS